MKVHRTGPVVDNQGIAVEKWFEINEMKANHPFEDWKAYNVVFHKRNSACLRLAGSILIFLIELYDIIRYLLFKQQTKNPFVANKMEKKKRVYQILCWFEVIATRCHHVTAGENPVFLLHVNNHKRPLSAGKKRQTDSHEPVCPKFLTLNLYYYGI